MEFQIWMGPGKHFVHYFVRSERLVNFVALVDQDSWTRESWTEQADVADVLDAFEGWHPQVLSILEAVDEAFVWGLFEHPPMEHWSSGRVTLLGDACQAMLPFGQQQRERDAQLGDASTDWFLKAIASVYGHDAEAVDGLTPAASIDRP